MKQDQLKNAYKQIAIPQEMQNRILYKSKSRTLQKGDSHMKSKKKFALIAAAAALVLGITAFASSGVIAGWRSSSSSIPDYTSLPTSQQMLHDVGYSGTLMETFENGYVFDTGSIVNNVLENDVGQSVEGFQSLTLRYKKGGNAVNLSIQKFSSEVPPSGTVVAKEGEIDIYEHSFVHKIVPQDYVKTEEELAAERDGTLAFAYDGQNHIAESNFVSVSWKKDGVSYNLMQKDGELSADALIAMAKELIVYQ